MATAKKSNFNPEDFSRFLIREFLKKSGFDRTYDIFMTEDSRPKVTMTKSELTNLLGMETLVRQNAKSKAFNTMLDVISHYLSVMKTSQGGVSLPTLTGASHGSASKSVNRIATETTQASTSSIPQTQPARLPRGQAVPSNNANPYSTASNVARIPPQTADPYSSKPAPIGAGRTTSNFYNAQKSSNQASSNSLFTSESVSQSVSKGAGGVKANNFTNIVADAEDEDWDKEDSPPKVNARDPNGMGFFNRAPLDQNNQASTMQSAPKSSTMKNNRQVPAGQSRRPNQAQGGFMQGIPTKDDDLSDFDDVEWADSKKGPNPAMRQQYNAMRPMTSGKPGMRGNHGIGNRKPMGQNFHQEEDLDNMLDGMDLGSASDPLTAINANKAKKKQQQRQPAVQEEEDDGLGFLKKAAEESKKNQERRNLAAQEAVANYKSIEQMQYNLDGYNPPERDSYQSSGFPSGQVSPLTPQENAGIKQLLFRNDQGSFHTSWAQGFYFDQKMHYAIFQDKGGPCGILATVQAFFIKHLLYVQKQQLHNVNFNMRNNLIASAITDILLNSASGNPSGAVQIVTPQGSGMALRGGACVQPSACQKQTIQRSSDQRKKVLSAVLSAINTFVSPQGPGVVCLVYSVILSKGVREMQQDFDFEVGLVNEYGYASQELINTMLVGKAASNVHDGDKRMGDDADSLVLKGIHRRSEIGFLTFFEHFGHFEVGENYKKPVLPIWIVCSESHYSILFSTNIALASTQITLNSRPFDLIYYDELARQTDHIILTVEPGKYVAGGKRGADGRIGQEHVIPIDSVIRTKWSQANINWNGRTVIL